MKNGVAISYGDIAVGAKESAVVSASEKADFVDLNELKEYNLNVKNFGNPCELYQTLLDGNPKMLSEELKNMGFWCNQLSAGAGIFPEDITLALQTPLSYASQGFTITFDDKNNIYCKSLKITWYNMGEKVSEKQFAPDSAVFFCHNSVEAFDKAVFSFRSINMPYNRLKIKSIDYGYGTIFYGDELRNVKVMREINPISSEIAINTCDFTLDSKSDVVYSFQKRQPLGVYFNGKLMATTFVKTSKRKAERLWSVQSEDYIGLLDRVLFPGGIYKNKWNKELIKEILDTAKVPFLFGASAPNVDLTGYIPYTTCREALMQVLFASMLVADASSRGLVGIVKLSDEITQTVPLERIMQGQNFDEEETVTSVEVTEHSYKPIDEPLTVYEADESGTGEKMLVKFTEPLHSLEITNGTITQSGDNYAIITANNGCVLIGKRYEHLTRIRRRDNPNTISTDAERIVSVENATLVGSSNSSAVLNHCFDWLTRTIQTNLKIVEGKHVAEGNVIRYGQKKYGTFRYGQRYPSIVTYDKEVNVGDRIKAKTQYLGEVEGRVIKETFVLSGGIIVKDAVLR